MGQKRRQCELFLDQRCDDNVGGWLVDGWWLLVNGGMSRADMWMGEWESGGWEG